MKEKGIILSIKNNKILITPVLSEACNSCSGGCDKKKTIFSAINPNQLELKAGDQVIFEVSAKSKAIQGILSLFIPFLCALAGFLLAKPVMSLFGITAADGIQALFVLTFLVISATFVFIITRKNPLPGKVTILEIQ